jgi:TRAP-type transport system periplasmic protein
MQMKISRRAALASAAGATFGILRWHRAEAAEFTLKLGHDQVTTQPLHLRAKEAADKVAEESGGRMTVEIYPNSQLGGDSQMIAQLRSGALEMLITGYNIWGQVVPTANIPTIPFAFSNFQDEWSAIDGPLGKYIHTQMSKIGLTPFDVDWEGGFRQIFTITRTINDAADVKGLKLRVAEAPIGVALFKALGASPTPIDTSEVYSALQTHLVDGGETGVGAIQYSKFYEIAKLIALTNHQTVPFPLIANTAALRRLPNNLQEIVLRNFNDAGKRQRADAAKDDEIKQRQLEAAGVTFTKPSQDSFRTVVRDAGLYAKWRDTYGTEPFGLLENVVGKLA